MSSPHDAVAPGRHRNAGVVSGLAVVIPGQPAPYGVLSAYARTPREFTGDEVHFLRAVANVIGGAVRDVRATQALREGEARFRGIFEQAAVGIAQVSLDGRWLHVNAAMRRIAGHDVTGLWIQDVTHPDDLAADLAHLERLLAGEAESYTMDKRYVRADGSVAWVTLNRSVVRDPNHRPLYFVSVIEDVSERRAAEQALRDGEARMRAVVDAAVDTIVTIDQRGLVESINPAGCRLFGYACEELVGRNVSVLMPPPYRDEHDGYLGAYLRTGVKRIIGIGREVVGRRKDGTTFPLDLSVSEFAMHGRRMFAGLIRDLTERRRLERQILDAGAEEQRRIGHDLHDGLCQQLTGLSFALEVLGQKLERRDAPEAAGIRKVSELVDQAITQARTLAHGLQPVMLEATGLTIALRELAGKAESMFHVACLFVSDGEVLVHDNAVATHLYRIAQEAISNAVRHGKARTIVIDLTAAGRELRLTITDDGIGLPAAAGSARAAGRSKGIGLQTMEYRARAVGGTLAVRPGERAGTVVTCMVPLLGPSADGGDDAPE
jgi:PAS domain S-box-containing protein